MKTEFKLPADNRITVTIERTDKDLVGKFVRFEHAGFCRVCGSHENPHAVVREIIPDRSDSIEAASGHSKAIVSWLSAEPYPSVMEALHQSVMLGTAEAMRAANNHTLPSYEEGIAASVYSPKFTGKSLPKAKGSVIDAVLISIAALPKNLNGRMVSKTKSKGLFINGLDEYSLCSNPNLADAYIVGTHASKVSRAGVHGRRVTLRLVKGSTTAEFTGPVVYGNLTSEPPNTDELLGQYVEACSDRGLFSLTLNENIAVGRVVKVVPSPQPSNTIVGVVFRDQGTYEHITSCWAKWSELNQIIQETETETPTQALRHNAGKAPLSFIFSAPHALEGVSRVLEFGANKYARDNWKKGFPYTELVDSLCRHLKDFMNGDDNDADSGLPHVDHILCNALFLSELTRTRSEFDDRGIPKPTLPEIDLRDNVLNYGKGGAE
ncbi:dATP/dGTP diphosphohydrolase domain-containing protein [Methylovulum miyakonense]|uniref:dATP/dGTP diphosphohydrolase domain-containing protein n=1 Tax=Methylovulum miyakonense TaxID=645578 RepID=UPI00036930CE|nr:dATP/dGTP diphosphohydrolase domain-containing protein [Methylovulum miyakonense]